MTSLMVARDLQLAILSLLGIALLFDCSPCRGSPGRVLRGTKGKVRGTSRAAVSSDAVGPRGRGRPPSCDLVGQHRGDWKLDDADWWLEEHGLIMPEPEYPLPPGKYIVSGNREVTSTLTVHPRDPAGSQRWELSGGATLHDVTHLPCRSARYSASSSDFPVRPGAPMPPVSGCQKQDYA
ncbi:unnamed protein product [Prorocentrum cordatum]|uniref:Uncharacterized protein n=1 Tax=Prorocentrum cordatum TaxID=2364126 RepID=A0ABN9WJM9_9DINO|nr:unnamed protein product [Polarella glacialis]